MGGGGYFLGGNLAFMYRLYSGYIPNVQTGDRKTIFLRNQQDILQVLVAISGGLCLELVSISFYHVEGLVQGLVQGPSLTIVGLKSRGPRKNLNGTQPRTNAHESAVQGSPVT